MGKIFVLAFQLPEEEEVAEELLSGIYLLLDDAPGVTYSETEIVVSDVKPGGS